MIGVVCSCFGVMLVDWSRAQVCLGQIWRIRCWRRLGGVLRRSETSSIGAFPEISANKLKVKLFFPFLCYFALFCSLSPAGRGGEGRGELKWSGGWEGGGRDSSHLVHRCCSSGLPTIRGVKLSRREASAADPLAGIPHKHRRQRFDGVEGIFINLAGQGGEGGREGRPRCQEVHELCYPLAVATNFTEEQTYMSKAYLEMMWVRNKFQTCVLELGYAFVFTDMDIVWFRNPLLRIPVGADIAISSDVFYGEDPYDVWKNANGGFLYARPSTKTIAVFKGWYEARLVHPNQHDQYVFDKVKYDLSVRQPTQEGLPAALHLPRQLPQGAQDEAGCAPISSKSMETVQDYRAAG